MGSVRLDVSEAFEKRPYRRRTEGLEVEGVPWIPLVGRNSFLRMTTPSPWHTHTGCIEIVFCQHGTCEYESGGQTYRLMPGQVFVSRPNEPHRMLSNPKGLATCYLLFRVRGLSAEARLGRELLFFDRKLRKVPRLFDGGPHTGSLFVRLLRLVGQSFADRAERRLRILNTSVSLLLSVVDAAELPKAGGVSGRISAIAEEMRARPGDAWPIKSLSAKIGFSPSSLLNGFKATTGYTPHAWLLKCRIDRAKELLRAGDRTVTAIADELGFPSPQHLATQFRSATGLSPRAWTKRGEGCS